MPRRRMIDPGFWDNTEAAQKTVTQLSILKSAIEPVEKALRSANELSELFELAVEESDTEIFSQMEGKMRGQQIKLPFDMVAKLLRLR